MGDTRNPLDVLDDEDNYEIRSAQRRKGSKKRFAPNWELILPDGTVFPIKDKETAVVIMLMRDLSADFSNRGIILRKEKYGLMTECDWKKLAFKPKDKAILLDQSEILLELIKQKIKEGKGG